MMKILGMGLLILVSATCFARPSNTRRLTPELASIKAANEAQGFDWIRGFDLAGVNGAWSQDNGNMITVTLHFDAETPDDYGNFVPASCTSYHWFLYDGTPTFCEQCQDSGPGCECTRTDCVLEGRHLLQKSGPAKK